MKLPFSNYFVIFLLSVHLNFESVNLQQLSAFLLILLAFVVLKYKIDRDYFKLFSNNLVKTK